MIDGEMQLEQEPVAQVIWIWACVVLTVRMFYNITHNTKKKCRALQRRLHFTLQICVYFHGSTMFETVEELAF